MYPYAIGDTVSADIPGVVTVVGKVVIGPATEPDGSIWFVVESTQAPDDGQRYDVRLEEIKVVLDSESD